MADLIVTLVGADQPGIVESLAQPIAQHAGNWLESRMAHLAGKFAGILRIEVAPDKVRALTGALAALEARGLKVVVEASDAEASPRPTQLMDLDLVGTDKPGIVREISRLLAERRVNIEELVTDRPAAPMSGEALFRARARVRLPEGADPRALRDDLEKVASDLMVEVKLVGPEQG